ncbi:hypothetical protein LCGC14_1661650, partial [marine sediment metagenome]
LLTTKTSFLYRVSVIHVLIEKICLLIAIGRLATQNSIKRVANELARKNLT